MNETDCQALEAGARAMRALADLAAKNPELARILEWQWETPGGRSADVMAPALAGAATRHPTRVERERNSRLAA
jgi:hypothetical protein